MERLEGTTEGTLARRLFGGNVPGRISQRYVLARSSGYEERPDEHLSICARFDSLADIVDRWKILTSPSPPLPIFLSFQFLHALPCPMLYHHQTVQLEDFLIANRDEYLRHSAMNYTSQQRQYNNRLTERLLELAARHGYVFDEEDFGEYQGR